MIVSDSIKISVRGLNHHMQVAKPSIFKFFSFLLIVSVLSACEQEQPAGSYKNSAIAASKREEFHKLNDQFFALLKAGNANEAKDMMSKELLEDNTVNRSMELIGLQAKAGNYSLLDEYYLVDKADEPGSLVINADSQGDGAYTLKCNQSATKENYVAFLVVPKDGANKRLVTAIYGKYNYGWKLNKLDIGLYAINGKNAPELYQLAKEKYAKGYWVDAANDMTAAQRCFRPSGQWQYAKEATMNQFYYNAVQQAATKITFPFAIKGVVTQPKVFRISTEDTPDGTFPMVDYVSKVNINDTTALKQENAAVKKVIGKVIPGIDLDKKQVLYTAYDVVPRGKNNAKKYEFVPSK